MDIPAVVIPQKAIEDLVTPMANDLTALFSLVADDAEQLLDRAVDEGWTPDQLIDQLVKLIEGTENAPETTVQKARKLDGRMKYQGLPVSIENAAGSTREGIDQDGHEWSTTMIHPYGYIRGTRGTDGDHVDVFVGPNPDAETVYVIHIQNPETGEYDEDKCFLGFDSPDDARESFDAHYDREDIFQSMDEIPFDKFVELLESKKGQKIVNKMATLFAVQKALRRKVYAAS